METLSQQDLIVTSLGDCRFDTPLTFHSPNHPEDEHFLTDAHRIRYEVCVGPNSEAAEADLTLEEAGPRKKLFFDPAQTTAALVTCGGLSPGLNNVIRSVFYELSENYGVSRVMGIRNGYLGLNPEHGLQMIPLDRNFVESIDKLGGTALGTSRGPQPGAVMADFLQSQGIDILFCVGGDGTHRGAHDLHQELQRRGAPISIVGIPKTIDNDIPFVSQSFGYATALERASEVIRGAHVEARGAINGVGLVKLMGRHAGFISAGAAIVSQEVDFVLVPEIEFPMEGPDGLLPALQERLSTRSHAVIAVSEGAGQHLFEQTSQTVDASGNRLHQDIGELLRERIKAYFKERSIPMSLKYLDPSYYVRSVPANMYDRVLCNQFGRHAAHAAMAGKTGVMIGLMHDRFVNVPIPAVCSQTKTIDVSGDLWRAVLESTGQPRW